MTFVSFIGGKKLERSYISVLGAENERSETFVRFVGERKLERSGHKCLGEENKKIREKR